MIFHLSVETPEYSMCVNGGDLPALVKQMDVLLASFQPVAAPAPLKGEVLAPVEAKPAGKPGRKPKAKDTAQTDIEDVTNAPEPEIEPELDAPVPTHDDVVEALKKVNGAHGMGAVREIIGKFNCQKISEVKPDNFVAVIEAAKEKMAA